MQIKLFACLCILQEEFRYKYIYAYISQQFVHLDNRQIGWLWLHLKIIFKLHIAYAHVCVHREHCSLDYFSTIPWPNQGLGIVDRQ